MLNQGWTYREQVDRTAAGQTVLAYYTQRYRHSSAADWQERIVAGQILLNGQRVTAETRLQPGQHLTYDRPPWDEPNVPLNIDVLYEDEALFVVAKPSGLPVLPGGGFLEHTLLRQLQHRYPHDTPLPIHRLGRGTSGLMLLARSPQARAHLSQQMRQQQIRKTYRALTGAGDMPDRFTMTQPIGKVAHPVLGYVYGAIADGLPAHSNCQVLQRTATTTLLAVTILTGRPHQIRIHLAAAGYPLLGDPLYGVGGLPGCSASSGKLPVPGDGGYWLHAHHLTFTHPHTGQPMHVTCLPPPPLREVP